MVGAVRRADSDGTGQAHSKRELSVDKDTLVDVQGCASEDCQSVSADVALNVQGFDPATGWLYVRKPGCIVHGCLSIAR